MRKLILAAAAAVGLAGLPISGAQAQPISLTPAVDDGTSGGRLIFGVDNAADRPTLDRVQYFWGGHNYCWYARGWRGPGWYWCGYGARRGYGWGGAYGWRGWSRGGGGGHWHGGGGGHWHGGGGGGHWGGHGGGGHWGGHGGGGHGGGGHWGGHGGGGHGGGGGHHHH